MAGVQTVASRTGRLRKINPFVLEERKPSTLQAWKKLYANGERALVDIVD